MATVSTVSVMTKLKNIFTKYPVVRGMISYGTLWPTACLIQQTVIEGKKFDNIDWKRCLRFCVFGGLYTAPTAYIWIRFTHIVFPKTRLQTAIKKAAIDQFVYGPFSISSFFIGMTLLEGKTLEDGIKELKTKFFATWQVGAPVWFTLQTVNFAYVPQQHRIIYLSVCSLMWSIFLAYMKQRELELSLEPTIIAGSIVQCDDKKPTITAGSIVQCEDKKVSKVN